MTTINLTSREQFENQISDETFQNIGGAAMSNETSIIGEQTTFQPKSVDELFTDIIKITDQSDINLSELSHAQQPDFGHIVHDYLNKYFQAQHKSEWQSGIAHAIAPPLPHQWVSGRMNKYYEMAFKGDGDKVHENNIKADRKRFLPVAVEMADALPEISAAMDIQILLDDAGHELAADAVSDLLVVYGITIHLLKEKQAKLQLEKQEKANRAAQNILSAELLQ